MKNDEFRARVAELAVIKDIKVARVTVRSKKQEQEGEVFPPGENPTLGFEIKRIKPVKRSCELACGKQVANQVIEKRLNHSPVKHWKVKCVNCGAHQHPSGQGLIGVDVPHLHNEYVKYFKSEAYSKPRG